MERRVTASACPATAGRRLKTRVAAGIGAALLGLAAGGAGAASPVYRTEEAFVRAMARRLTPLGPQSATFAEAVAARRCLNYISGAHGTPSLRQEIGRTNRNFALSSTQQTEFRSCVQEEGYRLR